MSLSSSFRIPFFSLNENTPFEFWKQRAHGCTTGFVTRAQFLFSRLECTARSHYHRCAIPATQNRSSSENPKVCRA
jgi:hypothetical protein